MEVYFERVLARGRILRAKVNDALWRASWFAILILSLAGTLPAQEGSTNGQSAERSRGQLPAWMLEHRVATPRIKFRPPEPAQENLLDKLPTLDVELPSALDSAMESAQDSGPAYLLGAAPSLRDVGPPGVSDTTAVDATAELPAGIRNQLLQAALLESVYLPGEGDDLGLIGFNTEVSLGLPGPLPMSMILISPGFEMTILNGPESVALPNQLYRASTRFQFRGLITERLGYELSVSPGWFSDFKATEHAFRMPGHIGGRYEWAPGVEFYLGVLYLDRSDINILPFGGVIWSSDTFKAELLFPKPRIAWRVLGMESERERWVYIAGQFSGGTWAYRTPTGDQEVTYRDFGIVLGWESLIDEGIDVRLEAGYVLGRALEFSGPFADIKPDDTFMLRAAVQY